MDLGLEFQKTILRIRIIILKILGLKFEKINIEISINISEILCLYVCVCQFSGKTNSFDFFIPNLPKMNLRLGIFKTIVGIRISIPDIPFVPIFSQNEQIWIFRAKFIQKTI